ncbi:MAG: hypothetical protein KAW12_25490 [Candidatus Aminicenantes bacterium]|nr:hypothetical protein [Candidatus Aminicenantes bacterium]
MNFREIKYAGSFKKDLKRLSKKFRTLEGDLRNFIKAQLVLFHKLGIDNDGVKQVPGLKTLYPPVYKARKFACRSLKGKGAKSGIRVIYAYFEESDTIEFIEIYFKGEKEMENAARIKDYLSSF